MKLISIEELKKKIDNKDDFKLAMTLGAWQFNAKHIPGSIHIDTPEKVKEHLQPEDDIVIYCSDIDCVASQIAYHSLNRNGYKNVRRFAGGISEWEEAGYPLVGEMVE